MDSTILSKPQIREVGIPILGCLFITVGAFIKIPFYPVPFTLQTFALFIIALTQSPRQAFQSTCSYLLLATLGLPVFCWHANPYWWMGKCAGYLWAFPIAVYWIAKIKSQIGHFLATVSGCALILLFGTVWLIPFVGVKAAVAKGLICFIPCELSKVLVAIALVKWRQQ